MHPDSYRICIIGLGYVGLPLAVEFGKKFDTVGFDINPLRIQQLNNKIDQTREVNSNELLAAPKLRFTPDESQLNGRNIFIVTVPTPINKSKQPDLMPLQQACELLGRVIEPGA